MVSGRDCEVNVHMSRKVNAELVGVDMGGESVDGVQMSGEAERIIRCVVVIISQVMVV